MFEFILEFGGEIITSATFAVLVIEAIKWAFIYGTKNTEFKFPAKFYVVAVPVLAFAAGPVLAWLGVPGHVWPADWVAWIKELIVVALSFLASIPVYNHTVKPLSDYGKQRLSNRFVVG